MDLSSWQVRLRRKLFRSEGRRRIVKMVNDTKETPGPAMTCAEMQVLAPSGDFGQRTAADGERNCCIDTGYELHYSCFVYHKRGSMTGKKKTVFLNGVREPIRTVRQT